MAARLPSRTAAELMEGGRELREAKLAELRRQLDEQEKAATPFKPTNFSKKDRYPECVDKMDETYYFLTPEGLCTGHAPAEPPKSRAAFGDLCTEEAGIGGEANASECQIPAAAQRL
eukprot:1156962-Pelagomonas_calceolata.AAC.3